MKHYNLLICEGKKVSSCSNHKILVLSLIFGLSQRLNTLLQDNVKPSPHLKAMGIPQTHQVIPHLAYGFHGAQTYSLVHTSKYPDLGRKDVHLSSYVIKNDGNTSMLYPEEQNQLGIL